MEINLKDTLRSLRQKKNVTQDALAKHLGITPQSVGKWERGEGFPDITLLPAIALYFDVTIDELLDVGRARIEEKIQAYCDEGKRLMHIGDNEANLVLAEQAYAEFPNDCRTMYQLMQAIGREANYPMERAKGERKIALGLQILAQSTEQWMREATLETLAYTYDAIGEKENARRYAEMCGSLWCTKETLLSTILVGDEGIRQCQKNIVDYIHLAAMAAMAMTSKGDYSDVDEVKAYRFGIDLWMLLYPDDNVGFFAYDLSYFWGRIAYYEARQTHTDDCLDALEKCADYAIRSTIYESGDAPFRYTGFFVDHLTDHPASIAKNYKGNTCDLALQRIDRDNAYDFLREHPRFVAAVGTMRDYASSV